MRSAVVILAVLAAVAGGAPAAGAEEAHVVEVAVQGGVTEGASAGTRCAGYAPQVATCAGSFTVTGNFGIYYGYQAGFYGYLHIKGETATYSVEIFCDNLMKVTPPSQCEVTKIGDLYLDQTFTWRALAPAFGYWVVEVPV